MGTLHHERYQILQARLLKPLNLGDGGLHIIGFRIGHGLNPDRFASTDGERSDPDFFRFRIGNHGKLPSAGL